MLRVLPAAFRDVFANRDLRRLQLAFLGSEFGLWAATVALAVIAFGAGGAAGVAILAVVRQLPAAIAARSRQSWETATTACAS